MDGSWILFAYRIMTLNHRDNDECMCVCECASVCADAKRTYFFWLLFIKKVLKESNIILGVGN